MSRVSSTVIDPQTIRPSGLDLTRLDPDAVRSIQRLDARGFEAYLVGGCVRDLLLDREPKDFDIATEARPQQVKRAFPRNCRIIGRRFKLAHLHFHSNQKILEVATFRSTPNTGEEPETDEAEDEREDTGALAAGVPRREGDEGDLPEGDLPEGDLREGHVPDADVPEDGDEGDDDLLILRDNEFGTVEEDALRRDFTVNALFLNPLTDEILDYVGGMKDVEDHVIRTIGDPVTRFKEDPVRILRAAKFAGRMGFHLDGPTEQDLLDTEADDAAAHHEQLDFVVAHHAGADQAVVAEAVGDAHGVELALGRVTRLAGQHRPQLFLGEPDAGGVELVGALHQLDQSIEQGRIGDAADLDLHVETR